jgi:hypothetical protein
MVIQGAFRSRFAHNMQVHAHDSLHPNHEKVRHVALPECIQDGRAVISRDTAPDDQQIARSLQFPRPDREDQ